MKPPRSPEDAGLPLEPLTLTPIGVVRTPFADRESAPRQTYAARDVPGRIELAGGRGFEHALEDLEGWEYLWVLFVFHLNAGVFRPKVLPPRSDRKRGVFSTRSPHRPNPIGLSVVRLERIEGTTLHVRGVDMIDGSPVLDIKPYVPVADAIPSAKTGWLQPLAASGGERPADPEPGFRVSFSERAGAEVAWLRDAHGVDLATPVERVLSLGPQPHPYRRIKPDGDALRLAVKDWRVRFRVEGREVTVLEVRTGYRPSQLERPATGEIAVHRAFVERFGG